MNRYLSYSFLFLGATCSLLLVLLFPHIHQQDDLLTMTGWLPYMSHFQSIYTTPCLCNYPILGLLSSIGVMHLFHDSFYAYQLFLAVIDGLHVLFAYFILRELNIAKPWLWAGIIGFMPAIWVNSALWGQFENISQLLILGILFIVMRWIKRTPYLSFTHILWYIGSISLLSGMLILIKQLNVFFLLGMAIVVCFGLMQWRQPLVTRIVMLLYGLFLFFLPLILADLWLIIPTDYISHYHKVLATGSSHLNKITANGMNIWVFLRRAMWSPSEIPLFWHITPKAVGIGLFVSYFIYLLSIFLRKMTSTIEGIPQIGIILFFIALIQLGFNVWLTGVHERYLFHYYPLMLIALLLLKDIPYRRMALFTTLFGSIWYGLFVFSVLIDKRLFPYPFVFFHVLLLGAMTYLFLIYKAKIEHA